MKSKKMTKMFFVLGIKLASARAVLLALVAFSTLLGVPKFASGGQAPKDWRGIFRFDQQVRVLLREHHVGVRSAEAWRRYQSLGYICQGSMSFGVCRKRLPPVFSPQQESRVRQMYRAAKVQLAPSALSYELVSQGDDVMVWRRPQNSEFRGQRFSMIYVYQLPGLEKIKLVNEAAGIDVHFAAASDGTSLSLQARETQKVSAESHVLWVYELLFRSSLP